MKIQIGDTVTTRDEETGTVVQLKKNSLGYPIAVVELYDGKETRRVEESVYDLVKEN